MFKKVVLFFLIIVILFSCISCTPQSHFTDDIEPLVAEKTEISISSFYSEPTKNVVCEIGKTTTPPKSYAIQNISPKVQVVAPKNKEKIKPIKQYYNINTSTYTKDELDVLHLIINEIKNNSKSKEEFVVSNNITYKGYYKIASFFYLYFGCRDSMDLTYNLYNYVNYDETKTIKVAIRWDDVERFQSNLNLALLKVDSILKTFDNGSETEILNNISEYIADNVKYTEDYYDLNSAVLEGKGVCNGYALMFNTMANKTGIKSDLCIGKADNGEFHAWNRVTLKDGSYRFYDVTAYDTTSRNSKYLNSTTSFYSEYLINDYTECWNIY